MKTLYKLCVLESKAFKKSRVALLHRDKAMPVNAASQNGVWPTYILHTEQVARAGRDAELDG